MMLALIWWIALLGKTLYFFFFWFFFDFSFSFFFLLLLLGVIHASPVYDSGGIYLSLPPGGSVIVEYDSEQCGVAEHHCPAVPSLHLWHSAWTLCYYSYFTRWNTSGVNVWILRIILLIKLLANAHPTLKENQ